MDVLHQLILERNARETTPFVAIHEANTTLLNQIDALQAKCENLERELVVQQEKLESAGGPVNGRGVQSAALKNEVRLREKLEKLQEELNEEMKRQAEKNASALETAQELAKVKDLNLTHESTIAKLEEDARRKERGMEHLSNELEDAKSRTKLAEQQYVGLKDTIRVLQEENDLIKKENRELESRFVSEKEKMSSEMNKLTEMVERLKTEADMLRTLKSQEEKRKSWFGLGSSSTSKVAGKRANAESTERKWGEGSVVIPTTPKQVVSAHNAEAPCVRYDASGKDLVATGSVDSTVKVWDSANGALLATLRGGSSNAIISCDISNGVVVGAGSDKTCRVWNLRTQRMIHQLVGHGQKVTCVKLFGSEKGVMTGSADRSMKVWDIARQTYRQTTTLRHSSTANCIDIGIDSSIAASAHLDGGIRFWDIRTGERTLDMPQLHEGAVTSIQFHPTDSSKVLTNGMDSCLKLVDLRTGTPLHSLSHQDFRTSYSWSSSTFSPDGAYVTSGSSSNGMIFVWDSLTGNLVKKLPGHDTGVCGIAWGSGGSSGQQVASVDKGGTLIMWA